jgi:hypothetical protein
MSNPKKYLDQLFISKVRIKAIKYFFTNTDKPIHLRGAVRELNEEINAVRRELSRMEAIKLLSGEKRGNRKYFTLNPDFVFFDELMGLVYKTFGLGGEILNAEKKLGDIQYALLTQKFVYKKPYGANNVDLVVIGDVDLQVLDQIVTQEEQKTKSQIHYTVLSKSDFDTRRRRKDAFAAEIVNQQGLLLKGNKLEFVGTAS